MYPKLPLDFIGITQGFSSKHPAIDLGWNKYQGEPVYAATDGEVVAQGTYSDAGNMIVIALYEEDKTILTRYLHLKDKSKYKVGDKIKLGEIIGNMGKTGKATGTHLHFEYWICPKNYKYGFSGIYKYAVNPLDYCYLYEGMRISKDDVNKVKKVPTTNELDILKNKLKRIQDIINE